MHAEGAPAALRLHPRCRAARPEPDQPARLVRASHERLRQSGVTPGGVGGWAAHS
jgi:hypothetical protein